MQNKNFRISEDELLFFTNKVRAFFAVFLFVVIACFLYWVTLVLKDQGFMYYILMAATCFFALISLVGIVTTIFVTRPVLVINLQGIIVQRLFKKKKILWKEMSGITKIDYSQTISISLKEGFFSTPIFSPEGISSCDFHRFLETTRSMILVGKFSGIEEIYEFLQQIKQEGAQKIIFNKGAQESLKSFGIDKVVQAIDFRTGIPKYILRPSVASDTVYLLKMSIFPAHYIAGFILLVGIYSWLLQLGLIIFRQEWSITITCLGLVCPVVYWFLYRSYIAIFYDGKTKTLYRGYSIFDKIFWIKRIILGVNSITIRMKIGRISYYWVSLCGFGSIAYCKLFITKHSARKFLYFLGKLLNLNIIDPCEKFSISDFLSEKFGFLMLSIPYFLALFLIFKILDIFMQKFNVVNLL